MAKVRIGFFSFTEVTDPAEHRSYNEWHQLDHMPEQFPIPGVVFGQRWVSTPACRRLRAFDDAELAPVHYMTLYLMGEPVDATLEEFRALGERLRAAGRFHEHRRSRLSGPFAVTGLEAAPRILVSAEAVPFRPNRGVYVIVRVGRPDSTAGPPTPGPADARPGAVHDRDVALAGALLEVDGVAGVWTFASDERFDRHGRRPGDRTITVCYLDAAPTSVAPSLSAVVRASVDENSWSVLFAGPLETITPWSWDWFDDDA